MADPICVLERIAQAIKAILDGLVTAGHAISVYRPLRIGSPIRPEHLGLILYQADPVEDTSGPEGYQQWLQSFAIDCYVRPADADTTPVDTAVNEIRARVEKGLRADPTLGGLAIDMRIRAAEQFATGEGADGVRVNVDMIYRTPEDDPYSL